MTNRKTLRSLADACEALSGPCRETDKAIWRALGHCVHEMRLGRVEVEPGEYNTVSQCVHCGDYKGAAPPAYTASIDSAMSLADPSWWIRIGGPLTEAAYGYSREDQRQIRAGFEMIGAPYSVGAGSTGTDPIGQIARALTAASLRAIGEGL